MSQIIKGTFANGSSVGIGQTSAPLVIPSNVTQAKLTLGGSIDANNTCKTQKSTNNGYTWADQVTYNAAQSGVGVVVAAGEHWRLVSVTGEANKQIDYELSAQS